MENHESNRRANGSLFPGLKDALKTLDLKNPVARGHLIDGRLGTLRLQVQMGMIKPEEATETVARFNEQTGLQVEYDQKENKLKYE